VGISTDSRDVEVAHLSTGNINGAGSHLAAATSEQV
jgi:hypothetical protein